KRQQDLAEVGMLEIPPHSSSACFQMKSACEAAEPTNSALLASNQLLHETAHLPKEGCQPSFAQNGL
ncbi:hypothetical protein, partial [Citrobacter portucalensis]|uniref:hypothetical protein n=1 Tax=Citrobacter portucalensis TaxID=1639133 RepID=UPI001CB6EA8F